MPLLTTPKHSEDFRLAELLNRYDYFLKQGGRSVRRAQPEELVRLLAALAPPAKIKILTRLETEISIFENMLEQGETTRNSSRQLWRFLAKSKLTPCSDVFDKVGPTDMLQVFNLDHTLLFMCTNFFDHVSFTLEQVFFKSWNQATHREKKHVELLQNAVGLITAGKIKNTFDPKNEWHEVQEVGSELLLKYQLRVKWISPVYTNGVLSHFLAIVACSSSKAINS
jgi:hypothetical protein